MNTAAQWSRPTQLILAIEDAHNAIRATTDAAWLCRKILSPRVASDLEQAAQQFARALSAADTELDGKAVPA